MAQNTNIRQIAVISVTVAIRFRCAIKLEGEENAKLSGCRTNLQIAGTFLVGRDPAGTAGTRRIAGA